MLFGDRLAVTDREKESFVPILFCLDSQNKAPHLENSELAQNFLILFPARHLSFGRDALENWRVWSHFFFQNKLTGRVKLICFGKKMDEVRLWDVNQNFR